MSAPSPALAVATGVGLALIGGYVDVVGVVLLFGLFVNHATGNLVMLGVSLAADVPGLASKLLSLPVFVAAAAAAYGLVRSRRAHGHSSEAAVLWLQAGVLMIFMLLTLAALPADNADHPAVVWAGVAGVCSMAIQNVGSRVVFSHLAPTTIMTGNLTQVAIDLVDLLNTRTGVDADLRARMVKTWPPVVAFIAGAIGGGFGVRLGGAWSLLPAALVIAVLGGLHSRMSRSTSP